MEKIRKGVCCVFFCSTENSELSKWSSDEKVCRYLCISYICGTSMPFLCERVCYVLTHIVVWRRQLYFCSSFMGFRIPQLIKSTVMVPTPFQCLKVETLRNRFRVYKYNVMMNRNILFILILCLCFCSCQKKYRYVEIVNERDILSGESTYFL